MTYYIPFLIIAAIILLFFLLKRQTKKAQLELKKLEEEQKIPPVLGISIAESIDTEEKI